jgi:DNA-binding CsgD family transcriptional regulator
MRIFYASSVPLIMVDDERRYIHANAPALLAFRTNLAQLRQLRLGDLTPPHRLHMLDALWRRLSERGAVADRYDVLNRDGTTLKVVFYARTLVPGERHVIAFAPAGWSTLELVGGPTVVRSRRSDLTAREIELLELAAEGRSGPRIAEELSLSPATVKTHFENIYAKLGVRDRAAAVAKALRLGVID